LAPLATPPILPVAIDFDQKRAREKLDSSYIHTPGSSGWRFRLSNPNRRDNDKKGHLTRGKAPFFLDSPGAPNFWFVAKSEKLKLKITYL
jgi:hypothetical protein